MSFIKDGEIKVFEDEGVDGVEKSSNQKNQRYTVDDLVADSEVQYESEGDEKNVHD